MRVVRVTAGLLLLLAATPWGTVQGQTDTMVVSRNDSVSARFTNADLKLVIEALARYLDRPVVFGNLGDARVTLTTPQPVARAAIPALLQGVLETFGLSLKEGTGFYSIGAPPPVTAAAQAEVGPVRLFVLHLRHAKAREVAATVNALYGRSSALGEIGPPRNTLADALRQNLVPPVDSSVPEAGRPVTPKVAELRGDVAIIPDLRTNNLLIRASADDFELVRAAVEQLDVRPLQVLIEVVIAEVRRDRSIGFGLDTKIAGEKVTATTAGFGVGDFVLKVMRLGTVDVTAVLGAAAARGDVTILSRPTILAANNEVAEILVGSQRPFIQVQRALPTDAPIRDQVVQFKDVGTRLKVQPTISDDGYVALQVSQEINAATAEVAFDAPVISTRSIQTQLLIRDGHTAVLGGLTDRQYDMTRSGVPILSSIPVLGGLFGRQEKRSVETELYLFLTTRVIRTDDDLDQVSDEVGQETRSLRQQGPRLNRNAPKPDSTGSGSRRP
jgi:general secretion pathway protein D